MNTGREEGKGGKKEGTKWERSEGRKDTIGVERMEKTKKKYK